MKHSTTKTFAKELTVLKNTISIFAKNSVKMVIILKMPELKNVITDYLCIDYLISEITKDIINHNKVLETLDMVFSLDEHEVITDEKAKGEFIGKLYELIDLDYVKPFIEQYKAEKISKLLDGQKALYESISGQEVEIVKENV